MGRQLDNWGLREFEGKNYELHCTINRRAPNHWRDALSYNS